jgi:hypothetical protein
MEIVVWGKCQAMWLHMVLIGDRSVTAGTTELMVLHDMIWAG